MLRDLRYLWKSMPPKWRRVVHVLWPSWLAMFLFFFAFPVHQVFGRWPFVGLAAVAIILELVTYWRIRPLLKEVFDQHER